MKKGTVRIILVLGIILANVVLDQVTKDWARDTLKPQGVHQRAADISYLDGFFKLTYVENTGAFLSFGADLPEALRFLLLHLFPVVLLIGLTYYAIVSKDLNKWQVIAMSFIIGGGISNIYDRLMFGGVTDFMNMGIPDGIRTGIFNFADVSIMIGLFMMLPFAFKKDEPAIEEDETLASEEEIESTDDGQASEDLTQSV